MPVVPMRRGAPPAQQMPQVNPVYLAAAAGTMHELGTLFEPKPYKSLEESVRTEGEVHMSPEATDDADKAFLKKLPDDIEREDMGDDPPTMKLRLKGAPTS